MAQGQKEERPASVTDRGKVLYKGTGNRRVITKQDWQDAGVESPDATDVWWTDKNLFMVSRSELAFLSDDEFNRLIKADPDFAEVPGDRMSLPRSHPHNNRANWAMGRNEDVIVGGGLLGGGGGSPAGGATGGSTAGD